MKKQYEKQCNEKALKLMGATVINKIEQYFTDVLNNWLTYACPIRVNYQNNIAQVIDGMFKKHFSKQFVA